MASSINASTSGAGGVITTADNTGILNLQTGGTNAITVDASQNVGIGTTSPAFASGTGMQVKGSGDTNIRLSSGSTTGLDLIKISDGTSYFWNRDNASLLFGTNNAERMRIDTSGNLLLGTTTPLQSSPYPNHSIQIKSSDFPQISYQNSAAATSGSFWLSGQSSNDYWYLLPQPQNKGVYLTYTSTTGWSSFSDETLKENLVPIENALNKINTLRTVTGNFIDDPDTPHVFLIAQDVKAVLPEAVHMNLDHNVLGMNYNEIIPLLTAGIKELKAENDTLKTQLSELKARIETLEAK